MIYASNLKFALMLVLCIGISFNLTAQCDEHQALLNKMDEAMAKKDASMMAELYHADAVRHTPEGKQEGLQAIQESAAQFYEEVPDAEGKNLDVICSGDRLVVRWLGMGTPAMAKKKIQVTGITIYHVKDGKIAEEWEEMNSVSMMMQMGYTMTPPEGKE